MQAVKRIQKLIVERVPTDVNFCRIKFESRKQKEKEANFKN